MKATKTELIRLARLAQKDIASGRVSKNAQQAVEALSDYQNSAIELLDLALEGGHAGTIEQVLGRFVRFSVWPIFGGSALLPLSLAIGLRRNSQKVFASGW